MCWSHWNALNKGMSVVLAYYNRIKNLMKIYVKMGTKTEPKIEVWAIRGPTFDVFGRFLKSLFFDELSIGEKSALNWQRWRHGAAKGVNVRCFGLGSAGRAVATGGFWSLTGTGKSLTRIPNALLPARGAADLKAKASCRRPPKIYIDKKCKKWKM